MSNGIKNVFEVKDLKLHINGREILRKISGLEIPKNSVFGIMGPSGSGKSTLLKVLNRLIEIYDGVDIKGKVLYMGKDIFEMNPTHLRREVGYVFQQPNPFPHMSIYDNIAYPLKAHGVKDKKEIRKIVEDSLRKASLWDEVKDRLNAPASQLSGGQQQRLTIARALALRPKVLLLDEPTSMIDVVSAQKIENLVRELSREITVVIVTHNPQQALRVTDYVAFIYNGELMEWGPTKEIFESPRNELTAKYVAGRFG